MELTTVPGGQAGMFGHPRRRAILAVMCLSLLVVVIDNTILNTALPTLSRVLQASTTDLQWITDGYTLAFAALLVMAGALGDPFGAGTRYYWGLVIFASGSAWAALSGDSSTLIAARAVMGVGAAFVMPATLSILTAVFPARERAGAISGWSAIAGVGIVVVRPSAGCCLLTSTGARCSGLTCRWLPSRSPLSALSCPTCRASVPPELGSTSSARRCPQLRC